MSITYESKYILLTLHLKTSIHLIPNIFTWFLTTLPHKPSLQSTCYVLFSDPVLRILPLLPIQVSSSHVKSNSAQFWFYLFSGSLSAHFNLIWYQRFITFIICLSPLLHYKSSRKGTCFTFFCISFGYIGKYLYVVDMNKYLSGNGLKFLFNTQHFLNVPHALSIVGLYVCGFNLNFVSHTQSTSKDVANREIIIKQPKYNK